MDAYFTLLLPLDPAHNRQIQCNLNDYEPYKLLHVHWQWTSQNKPRYYALYRPVHRCPVLHCPVGQCPVLQFHRSRDVIVTEARWTHSKSCYVCWRLLLCVELVTDNVWLRCYSRERENNCRRIFRIRKKGSKIIARSSYKVFFLNDMERRAFKLVYEPNHSTLLYWTPSF